MDNYTVLYAGGFKPITGAHIDIIKRYLKHPGVKRVVLFISPSSRDDIDSKSAYDIAKNIFKKYPVEVVLDKSSYSPILCIYRWIEHKDREPGTYAMASSLKGKDYNRVKEFTRNYNEREFKKNLPKGVKITELPLDVKPLTYDDGTPISASIVRKAILDNDYEKFKKSYPNLPEKIPQYIWKKLKGNDKEIEESGELPGVGGSGYQRNYPSQIYKSIKNVY